VSASVSVMSSILTQNHFELFSLPQQYAVDMARLDARYRELQRTVHPDRFASAGDRERRISMQQAAQINEAYQVLRDPLRRGRYLLELRGHSIDDQQRTHQDPAFLMQQIELRESLDEVRHQAEPLNALHALAGDIRKQYQALETDLAEALDRPEADSAAAVTLVLRMQFFTRLHDEVQALEADLEDELF
jgi:molecular chaperone HscB